MRAAHLPYLRTILDQAHAAAKKTHAAYSDPDPKARQTVIKASHVSELRTLIRALD